MCPHSHHTLTPHLLYCSTSHSHSASHLYVFLTHCILSPPLSHSTPSPPHHHIPHPPQSSMHLSPLTSHLSPLTSPLSPLPSPLSPLTSHLSPLPSHLSPLTSPLSPLTSPLPLSLQALLRPGPLRAHWCPGAGVQGQRGLLQSSRGNRSCWLPEALPHCPVPSYTESVHVQRGQATGGDAGQLFSSGPYLGQGHPPLHEGEPLCLL